MGMLVQNVELVVDYSGNPAKKTFVRLHLDLPLDPGEIARVRNHLEQGNRQDLENILKPKAHEQCQDMVTAALVSLRPDSSPDGAGLP